MKALLVTGSLLLVTLSHAAPPPVADRVEQRATSNEQRLPAIERHIRTLSADVMEGRGLGTRGLANAATYIESELREAKLEPAFGKSYRQKFPVKTGVTLGPNN